MMDVEMDQFLLNKEISHLEAVSAAYAQHFIPDARVRAEYIEQTKKFASELLEKCEKGEISPRRAAFLAQSMRNTIMEAQRVRSTALGLSIAKFLKKEGKTLGELEVKYADQLYKKDFKNLTEVQKNEVWRHIVKKAGAPQVSASNGAKWMGRAGRGLFIFTIAIAVYHIATSEDKIRATANEAVAIGGGMVGSATLGAAGLVCGPAAIACVPIGIFVGGVLGSLGADWAFDQVWR